MKTYTIIKESQVLSEKILEALGDVGYDIAEHILSHNSEILVQGSVNSSFTPRNERYPRGCVCGRVFVTVDVPSQVLSSVEVPSVIVLTDEDDSPCNPRVSPHVLYDKIKVLSHLVIKDRSVRGSRIKLTYKVTYEHVILHATAISFLTE